MPDLKTGGVRSINPGTTSQGQPATKLPETNYQRWYGRFVSVFSKVSQRFKRLGDLRPRSTDTVWVFDSFRESGIHRYRDEYHRSLYDYKVAASMQFHGLAKVKETQYGPQREIVLGVGDHASTTDSLDSLQETLTLSPIQLCYQFLGEGNKLPPGFLTRAIHPHFEELVVEKYGLSTEQASTLIHSLSEKVGLRRNADITFERLLELKNAIRWNLDPTSTLITAPKTGLQRRKPVDISNPATTPPPLDAPGRSKYQLDAEDKAYIQESVDKGGSLKIPKHDLINRLKRKVLRNKKSLLLYGMDVIVSTAISAVASGGLAAAGNLIIYLGWFVAWNGVHEAVSMMKVVRAMQKMEASADFALNPTDMEAFKGFDEEKFRTFMKSCSYVCSAETLTRIYNDYAELEKDVETSVKLSGHHIASVSGAIKFEESKARYRYRKKNLDISFDLFNRLYTGAIGDMRRMEKEWDKDVQLLWEHKFQKMTARERARLFNKAANDSRVVGRKYHFKTDKIDWLKEIFPQMASGDEWTEIERQNAAQKVEKALTTHPDDLPEAEKKDFNKYSDKVVSAVNLVKRGMQSYIFGWGKSMLRSTLSHGFKMGWQGVRNAPFLEITPQLPKISVDGLAIFGFFFLSDLFLDQVNSGVNQYRLTQVKKGKTGHTGITMRERTGREEIGTLRTLTKRQLSSFVDTLMSLHDAHKDITGEMDYHKHLNKIDPYSPPFAHMDEKEAAVLILRRKYLEQLVAQKTTGAIGLFHRQVQKKSKHLATRMTDVLVS